MSNDLLIGLGGLVLSVLTYFAGVSRTERRLSRDDREARVRRVFDQYMALRRSASTGGYDGLQKSGISTLKSNEEIEELVSLITAHGENHPLGPDHATVFAGVDLVKFFTYAASERVNFFRTSIAEVIAKSVAKT